MRYAVVIEKAQGNYSAYVPDLPGCVAVGDTLAEIEYSQSVAADHFYTTAEISIASVIPGLLAGWPYV